MSLLTIILFFLYCWGLGYSLRGMFKLFKAGAGQQGFLERFFISVALGLAILPLLLVLFAVLRIPLDWRIVLAVSLLYPAWQLLKNRQNLFQAVRGIAEKPLAAIPRSISRQTLWLLLVLLIVSAAFFMYAKGAFTYPYLEDEDPWGHSLGVKYVALEKKALDPGLSIWEGKIDPVLSYIDPYPPAYDILLGILHQTSPDLNWTMKFFNALIIALSLLFFYLFAKELMQPETNGQQLQAEGLSAESSVKSSVKSSAGKAALATFILASIPAYFSHFIWAHALGIAVFFPTAYAFLRLWNAHHNNSDNSDSHNNSNTGNLKNSLKNSWFWPALLFVASFWVTQNIEQPIKFTLLLLVMAVVFSITSRSFWKQGFLALFGGIAASFIWWGTMLQKYSLKGFLAYYGVGGASVAEAVAGSAAGAAAESAAGASGAPPGLGAFSWLASLMRSFTSPGGSGSRAYSPADFFFAQSSNAINSPIGLGMVVSLLVLLGLLWVLWRYKHRIVEENQAWLAVVIFWLLLLFWGVNGQTFPVSIIRAPFRVWLYLPIPIALLAAETVYLLAAKARKLRIPAIAVAGLVGVLLLGILLTSAKQKYEFNTSIWPTSGSFASPQEAFEYGAWFETLPDNTKVFMYSPREKLAAGFGAFACTWCEDEVLFRERILEKDAQELHRFLKQKSYQYLVLNPAMDLRYLRQYGGNETEQLLQEKYDEILSSGLFAADNYKENQFVMLKVN